MTVVFQYDSRRAANVFRPEDKPNFRVQMIYTTSVASATNVAGFTAPQEYHDSEFHFVERIRNAQGEPEIQGSQFGVRADDFELLYAEGFEAVDEPTEFRVRVRTTNLHLDVPTLLEHQGVISLAYRILGGAGAKDVEHSPMQYRRFVGDIVSVADVPHSKDLSATSFSQYRLYDIYLRTRIGRLKNSINSKIYVNKDIEEIVEELMSQSGFAPVKTSQTHQSVSEAQLMYYGELRTDATYEPEVASFPDISSATATSMSIEEVVDINHYKDKLFVFNNIEPDVIGLTELSRKFPAEMGEPLLHRYKYPVATQHNESDYDFFKRMLSREGYYFYHRLISFNLPVRDGMIGGGENKPKFSVIQGQTEKLATTPVYLDVIVITDTFKPNGDYVPVPVFTDMGTPEPDKILTITAAQTTRENITIFGANAQESVAEVLVSLGVGYDSLALTGPYVDKRPNLEGGSTYYHFHDATHTYELTRDGQPVEVEFFRYDPKTSDASLVKETITEPVVNRTMGASITLRGSHYFDMAGMSFWDAKTRPNRPILMREEVVRRAACAYDYRAERVVSFITPNPSFQVHRAFAYMQTTVNKIVKKIDHYIVNPGVSVLLSPHDMGSFSTFISRVHAIPAVRGGNDLQYYPVPIPAPKAEGSCYAVISSPIYDRDLLEGYGFVKDIKTGEYKYDDDGYPVIAQQGHRATVAETLFVPMDTPYRPQFADHALLSGGERYTVRFNFDRAAFDVTPDGRYHASLPLPKSNIAYYTPNFHEAPYGSNDVYDGAWNRAINSSMDYPLRINTQVIISYALGDIDLPYISGAVNDATNSPEFWAVGGSMATYVSDASHFLTRDARRITLEQEIPNEVSANQVKPLSEGGGTTDSQSSPATGGHSTEVDAAHFRRDALLSDVAHHEDTIASNARSVDPLYTSDSQELPDHRQDADPFAAAEAAANREVSEIIGGASILSKMSPDILTPPFQGDEWGLSYLDAIGTHDSLARAQY